MPERVQFLAEPEDLLLIPGPDLLPVRFCDRDDRCSLYPVARDLLFEETAGCPLDLRVQPGFADLPGFGQ